MCNEIKKSELLVMESDLAELRKKQHLSINKLSTLTGVPRGTIYRIEAAKVKEVPMTFLQALCDFFNVGIEKIIRFKKFSA